jgi:hypothetical protein
LIAGGRGCGHANLARSPKPRQQRSGKKLQTQASPVATMLARHRWVEIDCAFLGRAASAGPVFLSKLNPGGNDKRRFGNEYIPKLP